MDKIVHEYFKVRKIVCLKDMVNQSAEKFSDCSAFTLKDEDGNIYSVTFKQFQDQINALGCAFINLGLKDAMIAVLSENRYEWCLTYLAVVNGAGVIVPLDKELPENELASLL